MVDFLLFPSSRLAIKKYSGDTFPPRPVAVRDGPGLLLIDDIDKVISEHNLTSGRGVTVSIVAFQAVDLGSIPGDRIFDNLRHAHGRPQVYFQVFGPEKLNV